MKWESAWDETNVSTAFEPGKQRGSSIIGQLRQALASVSPKAEEAAAVGNSNFHLKVPVVRLPGRGLDLALDLIYNSRLWHKAGDKINFDIDADWPAPGWSLGFGKLAFWVGQPSFGVRYPYEGMLVDADGTRRPRSGGRRISDADNYQWVAHTTDGDLIDYSITYARTTTGPGIPYSGLAKYPDGTVVDFGAPRSQSEPSSRPPGALYPTGITDANGNYIGISYRNDMGPEIRSITDTLGRTIDFHYDEQDFLTSITGPGFGSETRTFIVLNYRDFELAYTFGDGLQPVVRDQTPSLIKAIFSPSSGTGYWFGDQDSYSSFGMLTKVSERRSMGCLWVLPLKLRGTISPGAMTRQRTYNYPLNPVSALTDAPTYTEMRETWEAMDTPEAVTRYSVQQSASPRRVEMVLPDGSKHVQLSYNTSGWPADQQWKDGLVDSHWISDPNGMLLRGTSMQWERGAYESPRLSSTEVTNELGNDARREYRYGPVFNQVEEVLQYEYERADTGPLLRRVHTDYASYEQRHIFNLPKVVEIYNGEESEPTSRTEYYYDGLSLENAPEVVGHSLRFNWYASAGDEFDVSTDARGNVTGITTYADAARRKGAINETRQYDITGNLIATSTSPDRQTSYGYTKETEFAYPTSQTVGAASPGSPARVTTAARYDLNTGLLLSTTDANGRTTQRTYSPASLRLQSVIVPTGARATYDYDDAALTVTVTTRDSSGQTAAMSRTQFNGLGLVKRREVLAEDAPWEAWDVTIAQYDSMGRLWRRGVPGRGGPSGQWSEISYDNLGRVKLMQAPDGSEVGIHYNEQDRPDDAPAILGQTERVVDAWGRERWTLTDALGRLRAVVEPNPGGSGTVLEAGHVSTQYDYDALDNVVAIRQPDQQRTFRHDSLGRLTHQHLPEKSATLDDAGQYVGTGGVWSDVFAYDDCSNLATRTDARGVKTVYDYIGDPLCRLQTVIYDTTGAPDAEGVLPASSVGYEYETTGDIRRISRVETDDAYEEYGYDTEGRVSSKTQVIAESNSRPLEIAYAYDDLNRPKRVTYPTKSGRPAVQGALVGYDYDPTGRLRGLKVDGTYHASQIAYNAAGQVESLKVGAGGQVTEGYHHNAATGLLDNQHLIRKRRFLLRLSYDYQRLGVSNDGRTGQLTRIADDLNPQKGRGYEYDALGRLVRAVGGNDPGAPLWTQEYSYDRNGNRTSVTATGKTADGTPIPPDGLAQVGYDAQTNRISTPGFEYDAAGNPTRVRRADGTWRRYKYDAAGRLARVSDDREKVLDAYAYGAGRQRVMTRSGDVMTCYVWSGDAVIAKYTKKGRARGLRWAKSYVHLGGRLLSTLAPAGSGKEAVRYHHPDRLGTRLVTSKANNAVLEQVTLPFGVGLKAESTKEVTDRRFTSYDRSETTGLDYAVNRFYDPQQGRFTQVDPLEVGAITKGDPQSHNLYSYVRNDPVNNVDPLGLDYSECIESPTSACFGGGISGTLPGNGAGYDPNIGYGSSSSGWSPSSGMSGRDRGPGAGWDAPVGANRGDYFTDKDPVTGAYRTYVGPDIVLEGPRSAVYVTPITTWDEGGSGGNSRGQAGSGRGGGGYGRNVVHPTRTGPPLWESGPYLVYEGLKFGATNIGLQVGATIAETILMPFTIVDIALAEHEWEALRPGPLFGSTELRDQTVHQLVQRGMNQAWSHWWHAWGSSGSH